MVYKKLDPSEVWDFYLAHEAEYMDLMHEIASNDEFGITVYLTSDYGMAQIIVEADGNEVFSEYMADKDDCTEVVTKVFDEYLYDYANSSADKAIDGDKMSYVAASSQDDDIDERETELQNAVFDLLQTMVSSFLRWNDSGVPEMVADCVDHFTEYVARKYKRVIYRPMYLLDEDTGEKFFTEYPYPSMVFDDEDNPIYKTAVSQ